MRKLGITLSRLAHFRRRWSALLNSARRDADSHAPRSRLTEVTSFGSNPGFLRMFTYVPKASAPTPPLVVVLHGCTQSAAGYDPGAGWSRLADRHGFVLLFPEQTTANNPKGCFNWFLPNHISRDRGEALSIRQMIEATIVAHNVDRARVFVTGLSAGGAMAAAMLSVYPELFAGGAIIAGLPYGTAGNVQQAFESMFQGRSLSARDWGDKVRDASTHRGPWPRVSIWHGDADATVVPMNAESLVRQWTDVHALHGAPVLDIVEGYPRAAWLRDGVSLVESYTITGMAHGAPLATEQHGGKAGPFLLNVGISSSYRIAKFFGLTGEEDARDLPVDHESKDAEIAPEDVEIIPDERVEILGREDARENVAGAGPIDVMAVITKALTQAGLMKPPL